jgi:hypothetical protein
MRRRALLMLQEETIAIHFSTDRHHRYPLSEKWKVSIAWGFEEHCFMSLNGKNRPLTCASMRGRLRMDAIQSEHAVFPGVDMKAIVSLVGQF